MSTSTSKPSYQDSTLPIHERVSDLISRMTLEEKVAQMTCIWNEKNSMILDESGEFDETIALKHFGHGHGIGQIGRPGDFNGGIKPTDFAELSNNIQKFFIENSRLSIPVLLHDECLHGLVARDATSFAQPIGLAATFNPELIERLYTMTAKESRACGIHQALAPVLDVARDPRWGRVEETFGEDPYLVSKMGVAAVLGFQGDRNVSSPDRVICTLKHFAAHGQPESGNNCAPVSISERHLREIFLYPFLCAIRDGKAMSVMASYNEIDGVPSHANRWLLRDVLRDEWSFDGTVVSDYYAIRELWDRPDLYGHGVAGNSEEAAIAAVRAGVNIELPEPDCYRNLADIVRSGDIKESEIDELVVALLDHKFRLGLFESPYVDTGVVESIVGSESHGDLSLEAARQVITLLKNDNETLPLDAKEGKTIAVIGPNADRILLGGYSGKPKNSVTILEGITNAISNSANILYAQGCGITIGGSWDEDVVTPSDAEDDQRLINEAVALAKQADIVVLAIGGNEQTSREAWMSNHLGDRTDLQMVGKQDELLDAIHELGKPIITVLHNGRPLAVNNVAEKSSVILECWYLGQESGTAIADVLFGKINPSGKLPISIPRSVGHIPCYYNYRPSARRGYLFDEVSPLYPFGYGLSYTKFEISAPTLEKTSISTDETTSVVTTVTNTGEKAGTEVVQVYIRDLVCSVTRPKIELKGFARVDLQPGESKEVRIEITPEDLGCWNIDKKFVVEPGEFEISVGANSVDLQSTILRVQ